MLRNLITVKTILVAITLILLLLVSLFSFRNPLLRSVANRNLLKIENRTGLTFAYDKLSFCGFRSVCASRISAFSSDSVRVLYCGEIKVTLSLWDMLRFKVNPRFISIDTFNVSLKPGFFKPKIQTNPNKLTEEVGAKPLLSVKKASSAIKGFLGISTAQMSINWVEICFRNENYSFSLATPSFQSERGRFTSNLSIVENGVESKIALNGRASKDDDLLSVSIGNPEGEASKIPLIENFFKAPASFSSFGLSMKGNILDTDTLNISLQVNVKDFEVENSYIADRPVKFERAGFAIYFGLSDDFIRIGEESEFYLYRLRLPMGVTLTNSRMPRIVINCKTNLFPADSLFESLPKNLFGSLYGVKVQGDVSFNLMADVDLKYPDSLRFHVDLSPYNLRIKQFGADNYLALNDTFTYVVYENGWPVRLIKIDTTQSGYTRLAGISSYLKHAVVASEDAGFFFHRGFDFEGIRFALIQNLTAKRFARGGSTITQQLVKNLYLNRNKNITRKVEEALIVWLIEMNRLASKERLLEIYFNIIEWGPNIYGIAEASQFYFRKPPGNLSLNEALFLTSIIPRPRSFQSSVDNNGNLSPFLFENHKRIAQILSNRSLIGSEELEGIEPRLNFSREALEYLKRVGSNVAETDESWAEGEAEN